MSERLTAIDIENQDFPKKVRGFDPQEVKMYLKTVSEDFGRLTLEKGERQETLAKLETDLDDYRAREKSLQDALLAATKMSEEITDRARREAEVMIKEARVKSERILQQAQDQLSRVEDEIGRARLERDSFERRLRSVVEQHLEMLELRQSERKETDGNPPVLRSVSNTEAG